MLPQLRLLAVLFPGYQ